VGLDLPQESRCAKLNKFFPFLNEMTNLTKHLFIAIETMRSGA
jgi:hypothetical protein